MLIVCSKCNRERIPVSPDDNFVQCPDPGCGRSYRVLTAEITAANAIRLQTGQSKYILQLRDPVGALRPITVKAQSNLPLRPGGPMTFVWRGSRMIGIADQGAGLWYGLEPPQSEHMKLQHFIAYMHIVCVLIALLMAARVGFDAVSMGTTAQVSAAVAVAATFLLPLSVPLLSRFGQERKVRALNQIAAAGADEPLSDEEMRRRFQR